MSGTTCTRMCVAGGQFYELANELSNVAGVAERVARVAKGARRLSIKRVCLRGTPRNIRAASDDGVPLWSPNEKSAATPSPFSSRPPLSLSGAPTLPFAPPTPTRLTPPVPLDLSRTCFYISSVVAAVPQHGNQREVSSTTGGGRAGT